MAAESRPYGLNHRLDIEQILLEAQHRWLRPAEICEILTNYQKFRIAPEPPNRPPSGSLFLFDRKVLRYFRKDGHNWRKKKDGKTVKEAHEKLKAGSIDVLHCYYAHGEGNENFQRRSYWLLEEERSNIVLVHYREVKGSRMNFNRTRESHLGTPTFQEGEEDVNSSEGGSTVSSRFHQYDYQVMSHGSFTHAQASEYEEAESVYNKQSTSGAFTSTEFQAKMIPKAEGGLSACYPVSSSNDHPSYFPTISGLSFPSITHGNQNSNSASAYIPDLSSWDTMLEKNTTTYESIQFQPSLFPSQSIGVSNMNGKGSSMIDFANDFSDKLEHQKHFHSPEEWQTSKGDSLQPTKWFMDQKIGPGPDQAFDSTNKLVKEENYIENFSKEELDSGLNVEAKTDHFSGKQPLLDSVLKQGLKKLDSFDRWISKELEDVNEEPHMQSCSGSYWGNVGNGDGVDESPIASQAQLDTFVLSPSLSQDQFFTIVDFSPTWVYAGTETKVLVTGKFLISPQEVEKYNWACMFGDLEVAAEIISDGVLRCYTPFQNPGRVPFYITCSNRLACSEVREFDFCVGESQDFGVGENGGFSSDEILLHMRFGKFLSLGCSESESFNSMDETSHVITKINSLLRESNSEGDNMFYSTSGDMKLRRLLKEHLRNWLIQKVGEGGDKGANVVDETGLGVLHFAAALGYDWAVPPTLAAGVNVNFRDVNGWTALHWAAFYGRERMVGCLISLGAAPGPLTDPTPQHPSGRTPADLASSSGHKGIAGYLAECALSTHLGFLKLKENKEDRNTLDSSYILHSEPAGDGGMADSLAAVRNATQAAARIHQVFRVESFQRKKMKEYDEDDDLASLVAAKNRNRTGNRHYEPVHAAAAVRIQNKYRSYKGRKEFLLIRQRIIKIQAHVRGHQVRKNYGKIIWSVGILEKVILRWRRKGSGLRGFRSETAIMEEAGRVGNQDDEFDFLKQGRKQTEVRLEKALARVKSMVQYPEARDQYRRLLNVVSEMQETKNNFDRVLNGQDEVGDFDDDLIDLDTLLGDDTFMS